jgi:hypothetical protein
MANESVGILDASLVSILKQTENTEKVFGEVMQALSLLPQKFKEELAGFGLKVIITPTILEILPTLDFDLSACFGIDQMQVEKMASCWPTVYLPPNEHSPNCALIRGL